MAVSIADQFEILPTIPRRTGRQINRAINNNFILFDRFYQIAYKTRYNDY
jgi:hypothetical protein